MTTMTISSPAEIIEAAPYLLGFYPQESVVALAISGGRLQVTGRIDIGDPAEVMWQGLAQADPELVLVVVFAESISFARATLVATLRDCPYPNRGCWTSAGRYGGPEDDVNTAAHLPDTPGVIAATYVAQGRAPRSSRRDIEQGFGPLYPPEVLDWFWHVVRPKDHIDLDVLARSEVVLSLAAGFAETVSSIEGRDRAWLALEQLPSTRAVTEKLREVARRVPAGQRVPVLFLTAWGYWRAGDGAQAGIALDTLLELDPDYSAARILGQAVLLGLDPRAMPKLTRTDLADA